MLPWKRLTIAVGPFAYWFGGILSIFFQRSYLGITWECTLSGTTLYSFAQGSFSLDQSHLLGHGEAGRNRVFVSYSLITFIVLNVLAKVTLDTA